MKHFECYNILWRLFHKAISHIISSLLWMPRHDTQSFSLVALTEVPAPEHTLFCTTVVISPLPAHSPTRTAGTCEPAWSPSHRPPFLLRILWTSLRGLPEASWMIFTFWGWLFPQPGTCFTFLCSCVWKVYLSFEDWFFCEVFLRSHSRNESFPFLARVRCRWQPAFISVGSYELFDDISFLSASLQSGWEAVPSTE